MNKRTTRMICAAASFAAFSTSRADAASIGVDFGGGLTPTQNAGVVQQMNWNDVTTVSTSSQTLSVVTDSSTNTLAGVSVSWHATGSTTLYNFGNYFSAGDDHQLFSNSWLVFGGINSPYAGVTTVTGLTYSTYNLIVYAEDGGSGHTMSLNVNGTVGSGGFTGGTSATFLSLNNSSAGYVQAGPSTDGNYFELTGLTGSSLTINDEFDGSSGGLVGFQIIDTSPAPEPASLSVVAISSLGLLARRRRRF